MGYGVPHAGLMVRMFGPHPDLDSEYDEFGSESSDLDRESGESDSDYDTGYEWGDAEEHDDEKPWIVSSDLSAVLTLPLDVLFEVCIPSTNTAIWVSFFLLSVGLWTP